MYEMIKDIIYWVIVPMIIGGIVFSVLLSFSYKKACLSHYKQEFYNIWITTA